MYFRTVTFAILVAISILLSGCSNVSDDALKRGGSSVKTNSEPTPKPPKPVPAYQGETSLATLKPTLDPAMFQGQVRAAYEVVKKIPKTIAQLPCYCHCDRSVGHKSLHSCFEDDHAANCGICMNSALKAYKLEKEQKMSPEQIRAELIKEYGDA
ncbi:MAG: PCYCGC domain-containing protein [Pyrinomonadaceae bacterium]|nr:PCYCGC domain-containing protein [Pyrinomonadaceae bacterium]